MSDSYDDSFLDDVATQLDLLERRPPGERLDDARLLIQRAMLTTLPDGSWPDVRLVQEALSAYLDVVDTAFASEPDLIGNMDPADRRWVDACRQCVNSIQLLDDVLSDLRADVPQRGPNW
jgi:hypothetical protein